MAELGWRTMHDALSFIKVLPAVLPGGSWGHPGAPSGWIPGWMLGHLHGRARRQTEERCRRLDNPAGMRYAIRLEHLECPHGEGPRDDAGGFSCSAFPSGCDMVISLPPQISPIHTRMRKPACNAAHALCLPERFWSVFSIPDKPSPHPAKELSSRLSSVAEGLLCAGRSMPGSTDLPDGALRPAVEMAPVRNQGCGCGKVEASCLCHAERRPRWRA